MPRLVAAGLLASCLLTSWPALGQMGLGNGAPEIAEQRYAAGLDAYHRGDFAGAAREFRVALGFVPDSPRLTYNLARCLERIGDVPGAVEQYRRYLQLAPEADDADAVRTLLASLQEALPEVSVATIPTGARVFVDGVAEPAGVSPVALRLPPGEHLLRVEAEGHLAAERTVMVESSTSVVVNLEPVGSAPSAVTGPAIQPDPTDWGTVAGWTAVGTGAASLVVGGVFTALAVSTADEGATPGPDDADRQHRLRDELSDQQTVMWVGYGVGAALTGAGLALLYWTDRGEGAALGVAPGGVQVRF